MRTLCCVISQAKVTFWPLISDKNTDIYLLLLIRIVFAICLFPFLEGDSFIYEGHPGAGSFTFIQIAIYQPSKNRSPHSNGQ